ncbi:MAG TPA: response regulator transcription factor [Candidatus Hydrogenedentes bacterium]|nr:response regulator transcription factor [Candidatus Hydrogenedentota bacterium]
MRILVAEDDAFSRKALEAVLNRLGYDVLAVNDGVAAWEALQAKDSPKIGILDWMMPGMTGTEVCQRARENAGTESKYLILLTSRSGKEDIVEGLTAGANDYVTKPFDEKELLARVRVGERVIDLEQQLRNRVEELEAAAAHIKRLQGILPICMFCHRIRDDEELWRRIEDYLMQNADVQLSHGLCPECFQKNYPDLYAKSQEEASAN